MKHKLVYLSGKMGGLPDLNYPKFEEAEKRLREAGYVVINPHKINKGVVPQFKSYEELWRFHMRLDIKALMDCHMIAVLDDWKFSPGAILEVRVSLALGMPMMCAHTLQMLESDEPAQMKRIPRKLVLKEMKRELSMRKKHFPMWITMGKITKADADHRIDVVQQVIDDYTDLQFTGTTTSQPVQSQGNLFN